MADKFPFTKTKLEEIAPPSSGRKFYYDAKVPYLCLQVTHSGVKSFYLYRRVNSKPVKVFLGRFPAVAVDVARRKAMEINAKVAQYSPIAEKKLLCALGDSPDLPKPKEFNLVPIPNYILKSIRSGQDIPIWSGALGGWLVWVKDKKRKEALLRNGFVLPDGSRAVRWQIFTLDEIYVISGWKGIGDERMESVREVNDLRREFDAEIIRG